MGARPKTNGHLKARAEIGKAGGFIIASKLELGLATQRIDRTWSSDMDSSREMKSATLVD